MTRLDRDTPRLIPTPRQVTSSPRPPLSLPASVTLPTPHAPSNLDAVLGSLRPHVVVARGPVEGFASTEAYRLDASELPIRILAASPAAEQHALVTLVQLLRQYGRKIPPVTVIDAPAFSNRGVMLDVSRDRVPTMEELLACVDTLAELKINHLQLYTEHTFAYAGHEEIWRGWSPLTGEEIRRLDERCRQRHIVLAANQNCFGHLASWLKNPRYMHLSEIPSLETRWQFFEFERFGPFSLCPTDPGSMALVRDMLGQLLPCFSSGLANINCDETVDVGQGRSRDDVARRGLTDVYFDFVGQVFAEVNRLGFRPMFWADIALSHPESVGRIPKDVIALAWHYEPDAPFATWCETLRKAGREAWVCPGTSSWRSITGRTTERRANIDAAVRDGLAYGATGLLVTDWGDVGHRQQWPIALHGIADAASAAWTGNPEAPDLAAESLHLFGDSSGEIAFFLERLGDIDADLRKVAGPLRDGKPGPQRNATVLFADLHRSWDDPFKPGTPELWDGVSERFAEAVVTHGGAIDRVPKHFRDEIAHAMLVAAFASQYAMGRRAGIGPAERQDLAGTLRDIIADHRRLWTLRSREGGLDHSCSYYEQTLKQLEGAA